MNRIVLIFFVAFVVGKNSYAVEGLTLKDAINNALSSDARISEKQAYVQHARALLDEAQGSDDITFSANSFVGFSPGLDGGPFKEGSCGSAQECQFRDDRFTLGDGLSPWFYLQYGIIKPLKTFGKIENYSIAAKHNIAIKTQDVRIQRGATIYDTKRAYYGYLTAKNTRLFLVDTKKRISNAKESIEAQLEDDEGDVTQSDLFAMESAQSLAESYIVRAKALEEVAVGGLKVLMGYDKSENVVLAEKNLIPLDLPKLVLIDLQKKAMTERPEMKQLNHGLKAQRALIKANHSMKKPNLYAGIVGMLSYSPLRDRVDNPHIYDPFNDTGTTPIVGVQWEWAGGVQNAKIKQAQAELNALLAKDNFAKRGIPYQVEESYHQAHAYNKALNAMKKSAKFARKWMISSYTDFEAGLEPVDKLVTAFTAYVTTYTDYLSLVYQYNMQIAMLEQVTGEYQ